MSGDVVDKYGQTFQERLIARHQLYVAEKKFSFSNTSLTDVLVIRNPSSNTKAIIIFSIEADLDLKVVTQQLNQVLMQTKGSPIFSAVGTAMTTRNLAVGYSDTTKTEVYHTPTVTNTGHVLQRTIAINGETNVPSPLSLKPGKDLLVRLAVNDADNDVLVNVIFGEPD